MNKKSSNIILAAFIIFILILSIGAEQEGAGSNESTEELSNIAEDGSIIENQNEVVSNEIDDAISENNQEEEFNNDTSSYPLISLDEILAIDNSTSYNNEKTLDENDSVNNLSIQKTNTEEIIIQEDGERSISYINTYNLESNKGDLEFQNNDSEINKTENRGAPEEKNICFLYDSLGKKMVEIYGCKDEYLLGIEVEELEKGELKKEVIISSYEHVDSPLTLFSRLNAETNKEDIKVFWKNEGSLDITDLEEFSVQYYDENENGLIDKISWVVPHLSEQIFEIVVSVENVKESENEILINLLDSPEGTVRNPINFEIEVNYSGNYSCELNLTNKGRYPITSGEDYSLNLENGNYKWDIWCIDSENSLYDVETGNFTVDESFYSTLNSQEGKVFFLDLIENKIKNTEIVIINSSSPSNFTVKLMRENQIVYSRAYSNYANFVMDESILNSSGKYSLITEFFSPAPNYKIINNFSVASANIVLNTTSMKENESVKVSILVNSPERKVAPIILNYGDGSSPFFYLTETNQFIQDIVKKYENGTYTLNLSVSIYGGGTYTIQKNGITVNDVPQTNQNNKDSSPPSITLLSPASKQTLYTDIVNFSYKASDNVKIQNCTFKLYGECASMNYCSTSDSNLVFPLDSQQRALANNYSVLNNKEVQINLREFDNGIYEWLVECYDNSSNSDWEIRFFEVRSENVSTLEQNYSEKEKIEFLKENADGFLTKTFSLEEKEVLEDLNILNDTKYYKKRLLDIENFFKENYKYVSSEILREKKRTEYMSEIENIENKIPISIEIIESQEYIKNSVESDLSEIIERYFESTNTKISKSSIKKLTQINKELQNELSVSIKVKKIEIEYQNGTQSITLVKKELKLSDDSYNTILEIVPKEVAETESIRFLVDNTQVQENLFEIDYDDLEKEEIVYYLTEPIKIREVENTETLLFESNLNGFDSGMTGFFVLDASNMDFAIYFGIGILLLILILFMVPFFIRKFRILIWKREPNVVRVFNLINDVDRMLKEKDIEQARGKYYRIKEIYPVLPNETKAYFFNKIQEVLVRIDRKDILNLVKEYQEAKRKWDKDKYMKLYQDIKKIYERLPEKDRKKVYDIINAY